MKALFSGGTLVTVLSVLCRFPWFHPKRATPSRRRSRLRRSEPSRAVFFEALDDRHLLSGVTLITHGFNSNVDGWVTEMTNAIAARPDLSIDQPRYRVEVTDPGHDGGELSVVNTWWNQLSPTAPQTHCPEITILLNWTDVAGSLFGYYRSTVDVAAAVAQKLVVPGFLSGLLAPVAELPFHLIGHSRGASLVGELARNLGRLGIWVDQVTTLDPHPVDGVRDPLGMDYGDAAMTGWENVVFWDNYWRTEGPTSFDFTGEPVANTYDLQLEESVLASGGYSYEHSDVHLWYYGTIDTSTDPPANNGDHDVPNAWYGGPHPARDASGYHFSRLVGGSRPQAGLSQDVGGAAVRSDVDWTGAEWPNLLDFYVTAPGRQFSAGQPIPVAYYYHDHDSSATISFYLDEDRNPYNGNEHPADQKNVEQRDTIQSDSHDVATAGIAAGDYHVLAKISDAAGHARWTYAPGQVSVVTCEIHGTKFNDPDGDGIRDAAEPGLQGWTIYLDANNNGQLDSGETSATTAADGTYGFTGLVPGTYLVREVAQSGWVQTGPTEGFWNVSIAGSETVGGCDFCGIDWAVDNNWSGFQVTGAWSSSGWSLPGRQGPYSPNEIAPNCRLHAGGGDGSNKATWTFAGLSAGPYQVHTSWVSAAQRADNATYTLLDGTTPELVVSVDQRWDPNDLMLGGRMWEILGPIQVDGGTLNVQLSDNANGKVVADVVFAAKLPDLPAGVMDSRYPGCTQSGTGWSRSLWSLDGRQGAYQESCLVHLGAGDGSNQVTWTFNSLTNGTYDVYTTWTSGTGRATNAPYAVYNGAAQGTPELAVTVNQQVEAGDLTHDGHGWRHLGTATVTGGIMTVVLADDADGKVVADAIYVKLQGSGLVAGAGATSSPDGVPEVAYVVAALLYEPEDYEWPSDFWVHQGEPAEVYGPYQDLPETEPGAVDAIDPYAETFEPSQETALPDLTPATPRLTESESDESALEMFGQLEVDSIFADDWLLESTWADV